MNPSILDLARQAGREPTRGSGGEVLIRCPHPNRHREGDLHPSCRINPVKNTFYCDVCQEGGGARDLARLLGVSAGVSPTRTPSRLTFCAGAPISAATQEHFRAQYGKGYRPETWAAFSVTEGIVAPESSPSRREPAIAFPLSSGGYHVYRYHQATRNNRWRFAGGGKPELIVAGLDRAGPVVLAEGEWDALRAYDLGYPVATGTGGAGTFRQGWAARLAGRDVVVIYDADPPGVRGAATALRELAPACPAATSIRLPLPGSKDAKDLSDYVASEGAEALQALIVQARGRSEVDKPARDPGVVENTAKIEAPTAAGSSSQASRLAALALGSGIDLFHDARQDGWIAVPIAGHREVWPLRSGSSRRWLARRFWTAEGIAPGSEALAAAMTILEAQAQFEGPTRTLHNRIAWHEGAIWYDLSDPAWRAVRVDPSGWAIVTDPPVLFRRHAHQRPQVEPTRGYSLGDLLDFINVADPGTQLLVQVYLACALVPEIPHPIPVLHGPQGAAKTTFFRILRRLVDPSVTETLTLPRDLHELVQQLDHHWLALYDNLAILPDWVSDAFCRAVTGEGFSKRRLYTDDEDVILSFRRCCGLNGINIAAHKPDLLDRSLLIGLDAIAPTRRRAEEEFWLAFERARPGLVGAALTALSRALAVFESVQLAESPRMADFARWGCAIARALGRLDREFLDAYAANATRRNQEVLVAHPVAAMVAALMEGTATWSGTASELLTRLDELAPRYRVDTRARSWPRNPQVLSRRLNEIVPNLAAGGIVMERDRSDQRRLSFRRSEDCVGCVDCVEGLAGQRLTADAFPDASDPAVADCVGRPRSVDIATAAKSPGHNGFNGIDAIDAIPRGPEDALREVVDL